MPTPAGLLIVNADDWGRDAWTTSRILDCVDAGGVSSVSAMVFMEDSERAAALSRERNIDAGLHLNLTTPLSAKACPRVLRERQDGLSRYLRRGSWTRVAAHPGLAQAFDYVVAAQLDEYCRLYEAKPARIDGHHHAHLCANVLVQRLLPPGTLVRRNFSFQAGEKSVFNRVYRGFIDRTLARRHHLVDFFFSLAPLDTPDRLRRIFSLARESVVEVATHPVQPSEYRFLQGGDIFEWAGVAPVRPSVILERSASRVS